MRPKNRSSKADDKRERMSKDAKEEKRSRIENKWLRQAPQRIGTEVILVSFTPVDSLLFD